MWESARLVSAAWCHPVPLGGVATSAVPCRSSVGFVTVLSRLPVVSRPLSRRGAASAPSYRKATPLPTQGYAPLGRKASSLRQALRTSENAWTATGFGRPHPREGRQGSVPGLGRNRKEQRDGKARNP